MNGMGPHQVQIRYKWCGNCLFIVDQKDQIIIVGPVLKAKKQHMRLYSSIEKEIMSVLFAKP